MRKFTEEKSKPEMEMLKNAAKLHLNKNTSLTPGMCRNVLGVLKQTNTAEFVSICSCSPVFEFSLGKRFIYNITAIFKNFKSC